MRPAIRVRAARAAALAVAAATVFVATGGCGAGEPDGPERTRGAEISDAPAAAGERPPRDTPEPARRRPRAGVPVAGLRTGRPVPDARERFGEADDDDDLPLGDLDKIREVARFKGLRWYIAPGAKGELCLLEDRASGAFTGTCGGRPGEHTEALWFRVIIGGQFVIGLVVPDGYTEAHVVEGNAEELSPIRHNVLLIAANGGLTIELTGPGKEPRRESFPPSPHPDATR